LCFMSKRTTGYSRIAHLERNMKLSNFNKKTSKRVKRNISHYTVCLKDIS